MASLGKFLHFGPKITRPLLHIRPQNVVLAAQAGYWNKDWAAGPVPKTPAEKAAAAKKYGLLEKDYEAYPDDGFGWGDYPKLPYVSGDSRDPYYDWDIPELKRNFGEPLHIEADIIGEDRWDPNFDYRYSLGEQLRWFVGLVGGLVVLYILTMPYPNFTPTMQKEMPYKLNEETREWELQKHYTFEPVE
ncbi:NADH dehydrogenase [ubiquinone] 1 beta subcomplex subunit 8, mitochondrial-like [Lineus longissimus]|uniref:NADH dehydrogenase [ubiquinone] 1 beta subcomplex subunit 8, mitochondrial-like n=1 Tax=Lineus longissimus TaxID=88925 RepID=UPI002B4D0941